MWGLVDFYGDGDRKSLGARDSHLTRSVLCFSKTSLAVCLGGKKGARAGAREKNGGDHSPSFSSCSVPHKGDLYDVY